MNDIKKTTEQLAFMSGAVTSRCMGCGKCTASCPAFDRMEYHPHQFVYMVETGRIDKLLASKSAFSCLTCFACVERCPRMVEPARLIEAVRLAVERQQGGNRLFPDDVPCVLDDDMPQQAVVAALRKFTK